MAENKPEKQARTSPMKYLAQVRQEGRKVVWPTWRETVTTTIMVMVMVIFMGLFFFVVDMIVGYVLELVWKIGGMR